MDYKTIRTSRDYIAQYADLLQAAEYRREHLEQSSMPPIRFLANGKPSDQFTWTKKTGTSAVFTDFPKDDPVRRTERQDTYTCEELGIEVSLTVTEYPDFPVIEYLPKIKNIAKGNSPEITELYSLSGAVLRDTEAIRVHHNNGGSYKSNEYAAFTDELRAAGGQSRLYFDNRSGLCTTDHLPNFNIESEDRGVICVLSWAADWQFSVEVNAEQDTLVKGGTRLSDFVLLPGEEIRMPMVVLLFYRGSWMDGQNIWRHWYYRHNVLRAQGKRMRTNLLYCISTGDNGMLNTEAENIELVNFCVKLGLNGVTDYINQDAGWYVVKDGEDWSYTGTWEVDTKRYPHGLKAVSDLAHDSGMLYSVWFEPERVHRETKLFDELGENALYPVTREDGRRVLAKREEIPFDADADILTNYADPAVVASIIDKMDAIIKENGIDQYRQDQNFREIATYFEAADNTEEDRYGIKRRGITEAKFVAGYHAMWDGLIARNPDLIIDSCSGGGRRNDLETVRKSFIHTRTDFYDDPDFAQCQTYGMSMWYMLMGTANIKLEDEYDRRSRIASSLGYLPFEGEWEALFERSHRLWKGYMDCFFSNYYPLTPYTADHESNLAMQFEDIDRGCGMVCCYIRKSGALTLFLRGLCPEDTYTYYDEDSPEKVVCAKGIDLMEKGITLTSDRRAAFILRYQRENQ